MEGIENNVEIQEETSQSERLGSCEVCSLNPSKYTCPRCEVKTCCLKCSKIHKSELECDGVRDRTKYKPLKQMTSMDFMNDYYFLEEATRFTKEVKCNTKVKNQSRLNLRFIKLRKEALNRNIKLYFLNNGLAKRKKNQSSFKGIEQTIFWFVELVFPNAGNLTLCKKFNENCKVQEIVETMLDFESNEQKSRQLDFYKSEGVHNLRVLLKTEGLKRNNNRFYEMNLKKSLKANLNGKIVIEYPTLHVVMKHSADDFDVILSDDETVELEMKYFRKTLREEVFSKKVGLNPPLLLKPEEIPIISEVIEDSPKSREVQVGHQAQCQPNSIESEEEGEVQPVNYFFSKD